jgi:hypothetical protein
MPIVKEQKFTKTPFKKQADVIAGILRVNPILNDDEKKSLNETVGVLTWMNQLQLHWEAGKKDMPDTITKHIFEGRKPEKVVPPGT